MPLFRLKPRQPIYAIASADVQIDVKMDESMDVKMDVHMQSGYDLLCSRARLADVYSALDSRSMESATSLS